MTLLEAYDRACGTGGIRSLAEKIHVTPDTLRLVYKGLRCSKKTGAKLEALTGLKEKWFVYPEPRHCWVLWIDKDGRAKVQSEDLVAFLHHWMQTGDFS
jgi:hypothetical protein